MSSLPRMTYEGLSITGFRIWAMTYDAMYNRLGFSEQYKVDPDSSRIPFNWPLLHFATVAPIRALLSYQKIH